MRATGSFAVVLLAAAGCAGEPAAHDLTPLADQADRVADLFDDGRPCAAVEAAHALATLAAADGVNPAIRDAVSGFVVVAQDSVSCDGIREGPTETSPSPGDDPGDEDGDEDDEDDEDEERRGKGKGRGRGGG